MKKEELYEAIGNIDDTYIEEAHTSKQKSPRSLWIKWAAAAACLCLILAAASRIKRPVEDPTTAPPQQWSGSDIVLMDDQTLMATATHIIDAVYLGVKTTSGSTYHIFAPYEVIKGTLEDADRELIYVGNFPDNQIPQKDVHYLLLLQKHISVYKPHNVYVTSRFHVVSQQDSDWDEYRTAAIAIGAETEDSVPDFHGNTFTQATELEDIIDFSSNIFVVHVTGVLAESTLQPTTVYRCNILQAIRGEPVQQEDILITLFNDTVTVGGFYVILLAENTPTSRIYSLAAKTNCVFPLEEAKKIPELAALF